MREGGLECTLLTLGVPGSWAGTLPSNSASSSASLVVSRAITEQKQKMKRLGSDLSSAQKEMKTKHKAYENAVSILSRRLQEALAAKESADAELSQLRAQSAVGGSDPALHVGKHHTAPAQSAEDQV